MSKHTAKSADTSDAKTLVVLGLDEHEKPRAARFTASNPGLVVKAAEASNARSLLVMVFLLPAVLNASLSALFDRDSCFRTLVLSNNHIFITLQWMLQEGFTGEIAYANFSRWRDKLIF